MKYDKIKEQVKEVIKYSQELPVENLNIDKLFDDWLYGKQVFIDAWEGELIKDLGEVTVEFTETQKHQALANLIEQIDYLYCNTYCDEDYNECENLFRFIHDNEDAFFNNYLDKEYILGNIKIPKGSKVVRSFKYFCENKELLERLQILASRVIQEKKVTGHLCMSVHPLDYLSLSENVHNWRSCHALDGEYRAGNLNYMADTSTVICYLRADSEHKLPDFPESVPWNSKKWRVLMFIDTYYTMIMAGRQYPFDANNLLLPIKKEFEDVFDAKFSGWINEYVDTIKVKSAFDDNEFNDNNEYMVNLKRRYVPWGDRLIEYKKIVMDGDNTYQFNDLLLSSFYKNPYYCFRLCKNHFTGNYLNRPVGTGSSWLPKIVVGKSVDCPVCGDPLSVSELLICPHCAINFNLDDNDEIFGTCPICGERFVIEEGEYVEVNGVNTYCCPACIEELKLAEPEPELCF